MTQFYGQEFLGAAKYASFAIKNLPSGRCGKTFSKEFGPSQSILAEWADQKTHPIVATQGLWRGGVHDYSGAKILTEGLKELEKFAKIAENYKDQEFQFSIYCEHKLKTVQLETVFSEQWKIVSGIPNITLVNTPMSGGDLLKAGAFGIPANRLLNEIHGTWNPNTLPFAEYMWACDGLPAQDCDIQKYKNRHVAATIIWLWMQQYNCKKKVDETTPISQRTVKPIEKQVTSLEYLFPIKGGTKLVSGTLAKTHADQHGNKPIGREQKPVIISKVDAEKIEYISSTGKLIHTAKRTGNYTDGRPLYRAEIWGFEIQKKATDQGATVLTELVAVKGRRRTKLGNVNPAFRENEWRDKAALKAKKKRASKAETVFNEEAPINPDWV